MNLEQWIHNKSGILSADADFFTLKEEQHLAPRVMSQIAAKVAAGAEIVFRDDHVDLIKLVTHPVDFVINFDYHMDCRLEFLHGEGPKIPPCNASLFESLLSASLTERYIWAYPNSRRRQVALVYSSAFVSNSQPLLTHVHCINGRYVLDELLDIAQINLIFVCRSPDYATSETDAIFEDLRLLSR
jgi:hypothetical protein